MRRAYEIMKDQRVAIVASMLFNFGVVLGILIDPKLNTPGIIQENVGIPAIIPLLAHLTGGFLLLWALRERNISLYIWGNFPIVSYFFFTLIALHYGATPLPVFILLSLLLYFAHEVTVWAT